MYTLENYHWGLVAYYLGVLLIMIPVWKITSFVHWFPVRWLFRVVFLAALATPMVAYRGMEFLAPAWGVAVFDWIYPQSGESWQRGIPPIITVFALLYVLALVCWLVLRRRRQSGQGSEVLPKTEPTLVETTESSDNMVADRNL